MFLHLNPQLRWVNIHGRWGSWPPPSQVLWVEALPPWAPEAALWVPRTPDDQGMTLDPCHGGSPQVVTCQSADVQCRSEDPAWAAWPSTSNFTNSVLEMAFLISSDLTKQENLAQESLMFHTFEKHPFLGEELSFKVLI